MAENTNNRRNTYREGLEYEAFVASLFHAVHTADDLTANFTTLKLERNKRIRNRYGALREFDVYWEYELDGVVKKTVIECKDYKSAIQIGKMDELVTKIGDIDEDLVPVFATKTRYQSGAKKAADHHEVELLIVREQNDSDWTAEDGMALIRHIHIDVTMCIPAHIHNYKFDIDGDWVKKHVSGIDTSTLVHLSAMNNEVFIEDGEDRYSLQELAGRLSGEGYGRVQETREFSNAFLVHPTHGRLKMRSFTIDYSTFPPMTEKIEIDGAAALLGVIEYVQKGEKKLVFKNRDQEKIVTRKLTV